MFRRCCVAHVLTLREVAGYLKIAERTVYRLVAEGHMPGFKVGGSWRFEQAEIDDWLKRQPRADAQPREERA